MVTPTQGALRPDTGKATLRPIRRRADRPERELPEHASGARRFVRALGRRVGDGDPYDLPELLAIHDAVDEALRVAVERLRERGYSDRAIGEGFPGGGISRQAVEQRWPRKKPEPVEE
jgi:hypothetical protein